MNNENENKKLGQLTNPKPVFIKNTKGTGYTELKTESLEDEVISPFENPPIAPLTEDNVEPIIADNRKFSNSAESTHDTNGSINSNIAENLSGTEDSNNPKKTKVSFFNKSKKDKVQPVKSKIDKDLVYFGAKRISKSALTTIGVGTTALACVCFITVVAINMVKGHGAGEVKVDYGADWATLTEEFNVLVDKALELEPCYYTLTQEYNTQSDAGEMGHILYNDEFKEDMKYGFNYTLAQNNDCWETSSKYLTVNGYKEYAKSLSTPYGDYLNMDGLFSIFRYQTSTDVPNLGFFECTDELDTLTFSNNMSGVTTLTSRPKYENPCIGYNFTGLYSESEVKKREANKLLEHKKDAKEEFWDDADIVYNNGNQMVKEKELTPEEYAEYKASGYDLDTYLENKIKEEYSDEITEAGVIQDTILYSDYGEVKFIESLDVPNCDWDVKLTVDVSETIPAIHKGLLTVTKSLINRDFAINNNETTIVLNSDKRIEFADKLIAEIGENGISDMLKSYQGEDNVKYSLVCGSSLGSNVKHTIKCGDDVITIVASNSNNYIGVNLASLEYVEYPDTNYWTVLRDFAAQSTLNQYIKDKVSEAEEVIDKYNTEYQLLLKNSEERAEDDKSEIDDNKKKYSDNLVEEIKGDDVLNEENEQ